MTEPVIDAVVFNEISELMGDSLGDFIEAYLGNTLNLLEGIANGLSSNDINAVVHNAHQMKGGSGSAGAMQVFQLAKQLEDSANDGNVDVLPGIFEALKIAYERVDVELRAHL